MRRWLYLVLAACSSASAPAPPPAPAPVVRPKLGPIHASHGEAIQVVAITLDGTAVVSGDHAGGLRLWPALDGTQEPIVVAGVPPRDLAIARDADGFAILDLDAAGGVELIRTSATGEVRARTVLGEQAVTRVEVTPRGLLFVHADQTITLTDLHGEARAKLAADAGTRIAELLQRDGHVLALVTNGKQVSGRWLELDHGLAWGPATPVLPIDPAQAVLTPDLLALVATQPSSRRVVRIDLATGVIAQTRICTAAPQARNEQVDSDGEVEVRPDDRTLLPRPLAFATDRALACDVGRQLIWWDVATAAVLESATQTPLALTLPIAFSDHAGVAGVNGQIAMITPAGQRFLGYTMRSINQMHVQPFGILLGKGDQQPLLLDDHLRERARYVLPQAPGGQWVDLAPIDDRYLVTASVGRTSTADNLSMADGSRPPTTYELAVVDSVRGTVRQLLPYHVSDGELIYDGTTDLLAAREASRGLLLRLDPVTHMFGRAITVTGIETSKLVLLDPNLSHGLVALAIHDEHGGLVIGELHRDDLHGDTIAPRRTYRIAGELRAVDRTGRVYVADQHDVTAATGGVMGVRFADLAAMTLRPSPDGSKLAAFADARVQLFSADGHALWQAAAWGTIDLAWTGSGDLFTRSEGGLAKLDLETGELGERACGWGFGLSGVTLDSSSNESSPVVCDVAP